MKSRQLFERSKVAQKLNDEQARFEAVKNLKMRIMNLAKRKKNRMSLSKLCKKHGLDLVTVSKATTGARLPEQDTINRIDKALKAEGA